MIRLLFICILFISINSYAQPDDFAQDIATAETQVNMGNLTQALVTLENILVQKPNHLQAQEMKINILIRLDRGKDAMKDIGDYISMYPTQPEYYYLRGILYLQRQKYSKAIDDFDRAIQLNMPEASVHKVYLSRGMSHFHNQDFEWAEGDFDEVIALDPKSAPAYQGKGMVKYELNEYEEAVAEFHKSLNLDDGNAIAHYNLAMSYFRLHDSENACYHFNRSCFLGHRNACRLLLIECDINISD